MQLTKHTDYALRVLMLLARAPDKRATIGEIAGSYRISENHLMKIVHGLAKGGYVQTLRGKGGGLKLARPAEQIKVGDVVRDTEETLHVVECLAEDYGGDCRLSVSCKLKDVLNDAQRAFLSELDRYTLRDLVPKSGGFATVRFTPQARSGYGARS